MGDMADDFRAWDEAKKKASRKRRERAWTAFDAAKKRAADAGLRLTRHSEQHYQISDGAWIINLYPGNQRIYADPKRRRAPFLELKRPWSLMDAVEAAINQRAEAYVKKGGA